MVGSRSEADGVEDWDDEDEAEAVSGLPDVSAVAVSADSFPVGAAPLGPAVDGGAAGFAGEGGGFGLLNCS